jgi:AraC family transcriptional regulator
VGGKILISLGLITKSFTAMPLPPSHFKGRRLETLVENRTKYQLDQAELNIFETHLRAEQVELRFGSPVLAAMIRGKKVMHLRGDQFDFMPGESVVLPAGELMCIDFPEATEQQPTHCLALEIAPDSIQHVMGMMNERQPRLEEHGEWRLVDYNFHLTNDEAIQQLISRLVWVCAEDHPSKAVFADFMLKELIIRLSQTEARMFLVKHASDLQHRSRLAFVIQYIQTHLHEPLSVEVLSQKACMSQAHFFRCFRQELGVSPVDFINSERMKLALRMLKDPYRSISDICYTCGFNSVSYFNRLFRRLKGETPGDYRRGLSETPFTA